ncbi:ComEC/Rec2 family competence protein [Formosa sediminum]|uniref:ComEC/Rec2 family competence protein n=1 Tax=Formosa sediminum TaxID=2594004 RepID=A0A516GQ08_9FLAO|nr:ComEC/Rec2 family competence protein [Formosa sediminum]QDO93611.1 ComEC/Rec2 family competence protein [Formosa sediminum]
MKLGHFIIVKLTFFLILGICIGYYIYIPLEWTAIICVVLLGVLGVILKLNISSFKPPASFGCLAFLLMIFIGIFNVNIHNEKLRKSHYSHLKTSERYITFKIKDILKPNAYYDKYVIDILKIDDKTVSGTALINIKKDSLFKQYDIDSVLLTTDTLQNISPPLNPAQFNYKVYLERQYIYQQITTSKSRILELKATKHSVFGLAYKLNKYIYKQLKSYPFGTDEFAIINALLLGQRQDISESLYTNYTKAGVIHILAVSGLHVGILLLLLNFVCRPLERLPYGKPIKTICIIILMWSFAFLTGLSPSVSRATLMFTLLTISINANRPANTFNTVAISAFLLLLFKPLLIFDVGFQLSYLAVLSIITIQPKLNSLWFPKHKLIRIAWNTLTVTTAAQVGVLPLSIYYFHQFPGLFFLSNLLIVPFLGYILGLGILIIALAMLQLLPHILVTLFNKTISLMNAIVNWIAGQDQFLFSALSIELSTLICIYFIMLCLIYLYTNPKFKSVTLVLLSCILLQTNLIYSAWSRSNEEWIIFHKNRKSIITRLTKYDLKIHHTDSSDLSKSYPIKAYINSKGIQTYSNTLLKPVYTIENKKLLIIDSLAVYKVSSFKPNYILLTNSPKINLNRVIDSIQPNVVIADGSNYTSYIKRWKTTCDYKKIPFHQTGKKGAYIFKN